MNTKNYIDKSTLKTGDRISFLYWGVEKWMRNKRFVGQVMEGSNGVKYISFYVFREEHAVLIEEIADVYIRKHFSQQ